MQGKAANTHDSPAEQPSDVAGVLRFVPSSFLPILGMLLAWSFLRTPIPAVNEPHYFCKAKHFWNPLWCANDFFLASSNPHFIFYCCFGPITQFASLEQTAVIARILGFMLLAWGWAKMTAPLLRTVSQQCLALSLFLFLQAVVNFSGEWLVGGAEAKIFSYGFGFWALGTWQENKSCKTAMLLGLAVSFHSLVGCWLTISILLDYVWRQRKIYFQFPQQFLATFLQSWREISIWVLCSLPGLLPSLLLLFSPTDAKTKFAGNFLQIYYRLKHHLDPMEFETWRYLSYGFMFLVVLFCFKRLIKLPNEVSPKVRILFSVLCASLLIAFAGVLIGFRLSEPGEMIGLKWRIGLLKFYPFRLFDLLTPLVGSIFFVAVITATKNSASPVRSDSRVLGDRLIEREWLLHFSWISLFVISLAIPFVDYNPSRMSPGNKESWLEVCQWIKLNTPEDCVVITPKKSWAFKWYAQRAEYVTQKDCPQDAPGIIEWHGRLTQLRLWKRNSFADRVYDREETARLARQTKASFLIADHLESLEISPVFKNAYYQIYQLKSEIPE